MHAASLLAIDVGSSRIKLGWFLPVDACTSAKPPAPLPIAAPLLPQPQDWFESQHRDRSPEVWLGEIERWVDNLAFVGDVVCVMASVHAAAAGSLEESLLLRNVNHLWRLNNCDIPVVARVAEPARVGIDRLLGALAVNRLKQRGAPAIAVDMGTATTVDLIAADGGFEGGAIFAGPNLSLAALHGGTASLPRLVAGGLAEPPAAVGKSTAAAMASGAFWGAVGAVRELISRMAADSPHPPELFLTGGAAQQFAALVTLDGERARYVPHLVLAGIHLVATGHAGP